MSEWIVYSKDGTIERCRLKSLEYSGTWMNERAVTATFEYHSEVAFEVFDYIEYRGEVFELEAVPTVKKTSSFNYSYELRFVSKKYELERCEMRDLVPNDNGVVYPTPLTFSFTGDVRYLVERIQACLDALYGEGVWNIVIADGVTSEEKNITIAQQNCWNALALVNTAYGLNFYVKGRTITIGGTQPAVAHTFEYGKGNGLYEIERASDTEKGIVTKLRAYGGTRNLDYSYPKKPEWGDSALPVSFALSPLRLMLPSFKTDGKTDFVLADNATIAKYGIREASMVYDDIYPTITGATNSSGQAIDEIKAVDAVDDTKSTFTVYLHDLGFDLEEHLISSEAPQLSMKSGTLQGYTFNISTIQKLSDGYRLVLGRNSLEGSEESGFYVPNADWNMKAGDKFVLLNILMPQTYIREAEERLLTRAEEYLAQYGKTNFSYNIGLHDKFLMEHASVYDSLLEGAKLSVRDAEIGIDEDVTIQSITITENMEENILPQVKVTLNNEPSASTLDRIQGKLNDIANETTANNFSSQSELMAQYRKKLDKPFFDKLFVAIDSDGNEIASNDITTPVSYIKARYDMAVVGGVTMYVDDDRLDIPNIYQGLPIDGTTIYWDGGVLKAQGGGSGGAITDITSSMVVSALGYTPANASDLTTLQSTVNDFLSGSDTDTIINKWKELEVFLSGLSESDNLATILGTKANKATTLAGYGIADAYTKSDVNTLLGDYVTLATAQTITGKKDFTTGGLFVNGKQIQYIPIDGDSGYWKLEGDLLVTGGITMFANEGTYTPSTIMDGLVLDSATLGINDEGQLYVKGGTGGGVADSVAWENVTGKPSFATVATSGKYSDLSGKPTLLSSFTDDVVAGKYLPLSGGTLTGSVFLGGASNTTHYLYYIRRNGNVMSFGSDYNMACISFTPSGGTKSIFRINNGKMEFSSDGGTTWYNVWHDEITKAVFRTNQYYADGNFAINLKSSDIVGVNALFFNDECNSAGEGFRFPRSNGNYDTLRVENGVIKLTKDVSLSDQSSVTSYDEVWHSGNFNPKKLLSWYGNSVDGDITSRPTSANNSYIDKSLRYYLATNSMTIGKPMSDGKILHFAWDNAGWNSQLFIPNVTPNQMQYRTVVEGQPTVWSEWYTLIDSKGGTLNGALNFTVTGGNRILALANGEYFDSYGNIHLPSDTNSWMVSGTNSNQRVMFRPTPGTGDTGFMILMSNSTAQSDTFIKAIRNDTGYACAFGVGSGGNNRGVYDMHLSKWMLYADETKVNLTSDIWINQDAWDNGLVLNRTVANSGCSISFYANGTKLGVLGINGNQQLEFSIYANNANNKRFTVDNGGNGLFWGGVTMHSDIRKKTKLQDVELSLSQIANAPLIEYYYNSDDKRTTHVGSIAQYWAGMNDWFCKKDQDGFYTMEIQNAALASAISVARHLQEYETKTDRTIRKLKKRIQELENKVEQLEKTV